MPRRPWPGVKAMALAASLVFSALLTAAALRTPEHHWLAWISFLPLFVAVRWLRPATAALAGGLWGACLYIFCTAGPTPAVEALAPAIDSTIPAIAPSAWLLALLIVIPAVYVGLAARPARGSTGILPVSPTIGSSILLLAIGWTLLEAVLHLHNQFGPRDGLLTGARGEGPHLHWLARLLGYVLMAFLVACVNSSLPVVLDSARFGFPQERPFTESPISGGCPSSQMFRNVLLRALRKARPRGPPIGVVPP